ncbi:MAG: hypothetical protein KAU17_15105, partial [Spirochaetales bacterium]|nr:hypothetical protein [Spirochaetales bacterium]
VKMRIALLNLTVALSPVTFSFDDYAACCTGTSASDPAQWGNRFSGNVSVTRNGLNEKSPAPVTKRGFFSAAK